ncbi:MAG: tetratricopeptide repeat protein [Acidobacteria bacterium]|nr:tetratricopeptide repeat protein [Acidobacteriota bacterium]
MLLIGTLALYAPVSGLQFTSWDDPEYVTDNPQVRAGLTGHGFLWALTSGHAANWHPVTWLSHMADVQLFGMKPGPHHLTNAVLHAATTVLLFLFFAGATGAVARSAFIAAMFAVHPAHVESVAWIAERKDVLSGFFFALTLLSYRFYVRNPVPARYALVFLLTAIGLMAKPMLVTLPFVLLLLDVWPLKRPHTDWPKRIREKLPLLALSLASSAITFLVQQSGGAVARLESVSFLARLSNAALSYVRYVYELVWPWKLAVVYPYSPPQSLAAFVAAAGLLAATIFAVRNLESRPQPAVGWLWFVGMLVPVIGIVQVGSQTIADRYTYLPFVGLFVAVASLRIPHTVAAALVLACAALTWRQIPVWQDNLSLWGNALAVTTGNYQAHASYASALSDAGRTEEAIRHYRESLRIMPAFPQAHTNLANALARMGRREEALTHYRESLRANPREPLAHNGMASALDDLGRLDEALAHFREAVSIAPDYADGHNNMAAVLVKLNRANEAIEELRRATQLRPDSALFHFNLGQVYRQQGMVAEARRELDAAARLDPQFRR